MDEKEHPEHMHDAVGSIDRFGPFLLVVFERSMINREILKGSTMEDKYEDHQNYSARLKKEEQLK
jgi:hypothetical protein